MVIEIFVDQIISKGEQFSDSFYNKTRSYIPFVARFCLLSSFLHENFMILLHWEELLSMIIGNPEGHVMLAFAIILCFSLRMLGTVMVLLQTRVTAACALLFTSSVLQMMLPITMNDISTFLINGSIFGSLIILVAENKGEAKTLFAGVPTLDNNNPENYMKLGGRCLLILMFLNFISLQPSFLLILQDILGCVLMVLVVLGYKTKLSVLAMILYLNVINIAENNWWTISVQEYYYRLFVKHKFLQGISVTGGLLMIVLHGPGKISLDEAKKRW